MSELDPDSYRQPGQQPEYVTFSDPQWLAREIRRTQEMIRELPEWCGGPKVTWRSSWDGSQGWHWFYGSLKRGRQTFKVDLMAVYVEDNGMFKGPRGLAFFAHRSKGMWHDLTPPRKPTAKELCEALGIDVSKMRTQEEIVDALTGKVQF